MTNADEPAERPGPAADDHPALAATRHWLEGVVIGLNLCPFAKAVHSRDQIRWALCEATTTRGLRARLTAELQGLAAADPALVDTTLLVHPQVLLHFGDYNAFLGEADALLGQLRLRGVLQIASFHPRYRFEGSAADDPANLSNRSPHPLLHLLREASVERAVAAFPDAAAIYGRNVATLRALGLAGWQGLGLP